MTTPEPKVGDRVRVSSEGIVRKVIKPGAASRHGGRGVLTVEQADGTRKVAYYGALSQNTIEILEPAYVHRAIYRDADGDVFRFDHLRHNWERFGCEDNEAFHYPTRPLTRIDREDPDDDLRVVSARLDRARDDGMPD